MAGAGCVPGDLGIAQGRDLYIAGRQKDMIILNGQNLYPQDIEGILEREVELLRQGRVAAFPVQDDAGAEGIGLALEIGRGVRKLVQPRMICDTLVETLTDALQVAPQLILLLGAPAACRVPPVANCSVRPAGWAGSAASWRCSRLGVRAGCWRMPVPARAPLGPRWCRKSWPPGGTS